MTKKLKMFLVTLAALLGGCVASSPAFAQQVPPAASPQECVIWADLALTSGTLEKHQIPRAKADQILADMYGPESDRAKAIYKAVIAAARARSPKVEELVDSLSAGCQLGGNMNPALGEAI